MFFFFYFHDNFKPQRVDINDIQLCIQNISIVCQKKKKNNNDLLKNNNGKIGEDMDFFFLHQLNCTFCTFCKPMQRRIIISLMSMVLGCVSLTPTLIKNNLSLSKTQSCSCVFH